MDLLQQKPSDMLFNRANGTQWFTHDTNGEYILGLGLVLNGVDLVAFSERHPSPVHRSLIQFAAGSSGLDVYLEGMVKRYYELNGDTFEHRDAVQLIEVAADCLIVEGSKEDILNHPEIPRILLDNFFTEYSFRPEYHAFGIKYPNPDLIQRRMELFSKSGIGEQECIARLKEYIYPTNISWNSEGYEPQKVFALQALVEIGGDDEDLFSYLKDHIDTRKTGRGYPLRNTLDALRYSKSNNTVTLLKEILSGDYGKEISFYGDHFDWSQQVFPEAFSVLCIADYEEAKLVATQCLTVGFAGKDKDYYTPYFRSGYNLLRGVASIEDAIVGYERRTSLTSLTNPNQRLRQ